MTPKKLGSFTLLEKIGVGGMGTVFRARYEKTGQFVAIKLLSQELAEDKKLIARFEREMAILKKLRHPHIVKYFGSGKEDGRRFYVMELVEGGSLETKLKQRRNFSWEQVLEYSTQICDALSYAHSKGIVHRDLKPANLLLSSDRHLKLSDFGIARDANATAITAAGRTVGTFAYMSPEQIRGKPEVTLKSDLYSLGCVMFELLTGQTPFTADSEANMLFKHLQEEPPRVMSLAMDCPVWMDSVVMSLLEKEPEERPRDAEAVQLALSEVHEKVAAQTSVVKHTASGGPTAITVDKDARDLIEFLQKDQKKKRKKKRKKDGPFYDQAWFLVACLLLLVGGITWLMWPASEDELFAAAQELMQSEEPYQWDDARRKYLEPLLERFPDGTHAEQAQQYIAQIEMHRAEQRTRLKLRLGQPAENEAQRLFIEALRFEDFGDRITAIEKYESMIELLKGNQEGEIYSMLASKHIADIGKSGTSPEDRIQFVTENLRRADAYHDSGRTVDARKIWTGIVELYESNQELQPLVKRAQDRLDGKEVEPLPPPETGHPDENPGPGCDQI